MFYPLTLFIALRYTKSKRNDKFISFVSLFATGGITLGVLALVTVLSVMNGFELELKSRILGAIPHAILTTDQEIIQDWEASIKPLTEIPYVKSVEPIVSGEALIQSRSDLQGVMIEGIDPKLYSSEIVKSNISEGGISNLITGKYNIILGSSLANNLGVSLGDKVRLISNRGSRYTPMGRIPSSRNFTVAGIFNVGSDIDNQLILINAVDAARLFRLNKGSVTGLRIYFFDPFDIEKWTPPILKANEKLLDWRVTHGELFQAVKMEKNMIWLLLCLIVAVAAFNILSSSVMLVNDKKSEVAILKTLGISNKGLNFIFIIQGALSGIIGSILGTVLGLILATYINQILQFLGLHLLSNASGGARLLPVLFEPIQIISITLGAIFLSLIATLYPAFKAGNLNPIETLRYE